MSSADVFVMPDSWQFYQATLGYRGGLVEVAGEPHGSCATEMFRAGKGIDEVAARYDVTRQGVYRYFNKSAVVALQDEGREARRRKRKKL